MLPEDQDYYETHRRDDRPARDHVQKEEGFTKNPSEMSDEEYSSWVAERMMGGWIPLATYQRMYPEETQAKIDTRVSRGVWQRGVHYSVPPQSRAWVNLPAIRKWVESGSPGFETREG